MNRTRPALSHAALDQVGLVDIHGRKLDYLRLAVTRRCNLRCRYCKPPGGSAFPYSDLSADELIRLARILCRLGVRKIRVTGGEPLLRDDIGDILSELRCTPGLEQLHITTNGVFLRRKLASILQAGVNGVNVSLDSLRADRYRDIVGADLLSEVQAGIEAALATGLRVKINVVLQPGVNDDEIGDFCELARTKNLCVRFIELMPCRSNGACGAALPSHQVLAMIRRLYPALQELPAAPHSTARIYAGPDWLGSVGLIPAYSRLFCRSCNRLRITPEGKLKLCLYQSGGVDLAELLRAGASDDEIEQTILRALRWKPADGVEAETHSRARREPMIFIGG